MNVVQVFANPNLPDPPAWCDNRHAIRKLSDATVQSEKPNAYRSQYPAKTPLRD
jgi:hypothetical protein